MKKSIIYLGVFAAMCFSTTYARNLELDQQIIESEASRGATNLVSESLSKPTINLESENSVMESVETISVHYKKTIEEIIEQDQKITDYSEVLYQPLTIDTTIEDFIRINNQIIDSTINNEIYPLDFNKINEQNKISNNYEFRNSEALKS